MLNIANQQLMHLPAAQRQCWCSQYAFMCFGGATLKGGGRFFSVG